MARIKQLKQYIIHVRNQNDLNSLKNELSSWHVPITRTYKNVFFGFDAKLTGLLYTWYKNDPRILKIEESSEYELFDVQTNAPLHLDRIDQRNFPLSGSYTYSADGTGVTAYLIDTGIIYLNYGDSRGVALGEFGGRASPLDEVGFPGKPLDPSADILELQGKTVQYPRGWDESGHGTHVAGILGSETYGVAKNITLKSAKVFSTLTAAFSSDIIAGIDAVLEDYNNNGQPPAVCNMSLGQNIGFGDPETAVETAVKAMVTAGITVVVAAGNAGVDANTVSPARLSEVITIGAVDQADRIADFSNFNNDNENIIAPGDFGSTPSAQTNTGSAVDIFAPGVGVVSTYLPTTFPNGNTIEIATFSGTSMASPMVAGVTGLILENSPSLTPAQVETDLITNATSGIITGALNGAPNLLLYSVFVDHTITWTTPAGSLGSVDEGFSSNIQLIASGVTGQPIMYSLISGSLPTGITLNAITGLISGTAPIVAVDTTYNFTVRASDTVVFSDRSFSLTVAQADLPPSWLSAPYLGSVEEGSEFSIKLSAVSNNGIDPLSLTYAKVTNLPEGWILNPDGYLNGIGLTQINFDTDVVFEALVTDGLASATREFTLTNTQRFQDTGPPEEPEWITPSGNLGTAIEDIFFSTFVQAVDADGIPQPLTYHLSLTEDGSTFGPFGRLPPGLQLNENTGEIFGTVNGLVGLGVPTIYDGGTMTFDSGDTTFDEDSVVIPGSVTTFDTATMVLDGGDTTFDGEIASIGVDFEFAIFVFDGANVVARLFSINALTAPPNNPPTWVTPSGIVATVNGLDAVDIQLVADDPNAGPLPLRYTYVGGFLPDELTLNPNSGRITGIIGNVGAEYVYSFVIRASDGFDFIDRTFAIVVRKTNNPPEWITPSGVIREINEGQFLSLQLVAEDPEGDEVYYSLISGNLPPNVILNRDTGLLSGAIVDVDSDTEFTFTIRADDSKSNLIGEALFNEREFTIRVLDGALNLNKPPEWVTLSGALINGTEGQAYYAKVEATDPDGGPQPIKYTLVGGFLPNGLALNQNSGIISGYPTDADIIDTTETFIIRAFDGVSFTDRTFSITIFDVDNINLPPEWITPGVPSSLGQFPELTPVVIGLQASDPEDDPLTYSIVAGVFPPGLTLDLNTGLISGTPLDVASDTVFIFTARVADEDGFADRDFSIEVLNVINLAPVWTTAPGLLGSFNESSPLSIALLAVDPDVGPSSLSFNVTSGSLPPGLSLDSSTGIISGTPSDVGLDTLFTFDVTVDDGLAFVPRSFDIEILDVPAFLGPTTELSVALTGPNKLEWKEWNNDSLIPDVDLYMDGNPDYGRVGFDPSDEFPKVFITNNLYTNDPTEVFGLFGTHHMTFRALIGILDYAVVRDPDDNVVYEVIYQNIVDPQQGSDFDILSGSTPSALDTNGAETYISKNFEHLRTELKTFPNDEELPAWMRSEQTAGDPDSVIGYIPAIEVAFVKPGKGKALTEVLNKIEIIETSIVSQETTFDTQDIRGDVVDPTVTAGHSLIIDSVEVFMTGNSIEQARDDINTASIPGIVASVVTGSQFILGPFNSSQLIFGDVLVLAYTNPNIILGNGTGTALADLGFTPGTKSQTIFDFDTTTFDLTEDILVQVIRGPGLQFTGREFIVDRYLFEDTLGNTKWLKFRTDTQKPEWITPSGLVATLDYSTLVIGDPIPPVQLEAESPSSLTITYLLITGELPGSLTLNSVTGDIEGTVDTVLNHTPGMMVLPVTTHFVVRATDSEGRYIDRGFNIKVGGTSFDASSMTLTDILDGGATTFDVTT